METPAFVIDPATLAANARRARELVCDRRTRLLFALKSFSVARGVESIAEEVDGFAASSLFEARLAALLRKPHQGIHVTTPGLRPDEIDALCRTADYLSFNSLGQWLRFKEQALGKVSCGLRVNPRLPFVADDRYNPCRSHSKLGVPLEELETVVRERPGTLDRLEGLHFHSNCDSSDLRPLLLTVERLVESLAPLLGRIRWLNLGGGYLFDAPLHREALARAKEIMAAHGIGRIYVEPGAAIARSAGFMVATVVDLFPSGGRRIAVLDTSVNHMPEVFEYQWRPPVSGSRGDGEYAYVLAGSACLAGDLFGEYRFAAPLEIGQRVLFPDMGAYSLVKANMFNGVNLPALYLLHESGDLELIKRFGFGDYLNLCGGSHAADI